MTHHSEAPGPHPPADNPTVGHEERDAQVRPIVLFGAFLLVLVIVSYVAVWGLGLGYRAATPPLDVLPTAEDPAARLPPPPRVQGDPDLDYRQYVAEYQAILHGYGWADQARGTFHIPIERAMELTLERGLPARQAAPPAAAPTSRP